MSGSTYRHSRVLARTERHTPCRSRPGPAGSLPELAMRWWHTPRHPQAQAAASARLAALLGHEGPLSELNAELCALLRDGTMDRDTPGLLAALKANIQDQIAIDQPNYAPEPSR